MKPGTLYRIKTPEKNSRRELLTFCRGTGDWISISNDKGVFVLLGPYTMFRKGVDGHHGENEIIFKRFLFHNRDWPGYEFLIPQGQVVWLNKTDLKMLAKVERPRP